MPHAPRLELDVHSLSHDGRAVCRDGAKVIFVRGGLPGQRIRVRLTHEKKRFAEGVCEAVLRPAPDALPAPCPHAALCGGCPLQAMPHGQQLHWKTRILEEALRRIGKLPSVPLSPILPSPRQWGYRNKMEFAFGGGAGAELRLGLRAAASHEVVDIHGCLLLPAGGMEILAEARRLAAATGLPAWRPGPRPDAAPSTEDAPCAARTAQPQNAIRSQGAIRSEKMARPQNAIRPENADRPEHMDRPQNMDRPEAGFWRHLVLRMPHPPLPAQGGDSGKPGHGANADVAGDGPPQALLTCITAPGDARARAAVEELGRQLLARMPQVVGFAHDERRSADMLALGEHTVTRLGETALCETLGKLVFCVEHDGFFQVNTPAAEHLHMAARRMAALRSGETLWDLYCGAGAPGLFLAPEAAALWGVEASARAVDMARRNAAAAGMSHCRYTAGDAARVIKDWPAPDVVLADPPRAGLHPDVTRRILRARPQKIIYISCNPATLARDVAAMTAEYAVDEVVPVDLFPQTPHVESVTCLLRRAGA